MKRFVLLSLIALPLFAEQRLELVRHSLTGTHCRYREYVNGIPHDSYEVRPCELSMQRQHALPNTPLRIIDGRIARREIVAEKPLEPWAYDYDVETGALIRSEPLFFHAKPARVFDPNPVVTLNDPTLQDHNDSASAVPAHAYRGVVLLDLVASGPLAGPHVQIVDRQAPNIAPIDASANLVLDREHDGFEDVNVYFHIDRTQRYLQSLGYTGARSIAAYAIEADAHAAGGSDNSFFVPSPTTASIGTLHFGDGGTDDAEDADLVVHEYGHAILEWISPGTFGGVFTSEARALSEGFGDYFAYSAHSAQRIASGRDPFCFADWDARCWEDEGSQQCGYQPGSDCLRRLDSTLTMADFEQNGGGGVEHRNGTIWSSALREIHQQLGRTITDTIVLESLFGVPPKPTYAVMAQRMIAADRLLFSGAHIQTICAAMLARQIVTTCDATLPRGEQTLFQSGDRAIAIPDGISNGVTSEITITDTRAIERIFVRVDITHPVRGDLRIELVAPDGTIVLLQRISAERDADVHTTFGLTAQSDEPLDILHGRSAAGTWKLVVSDQRLRDIGSLQSWGLVLQLEGDAPLTERPRAEITQMIPVVAHLFGVGATKFASDVRIANVRDEATTATLIFTRSGHDGRTDFAALDVALNAGQTIAFDDVVDSAFHTAGSGTLEVLGDVVVMSRTYAESEGGTLGQQVPPNLETTSVGAPSLYVVPLPLDNHRYNLGITETAGASGAVQVGDRVIEIEPFSHVQFPITPLVTEIRVVAGDARVSAYVSQVNNENGDAMFVPAEPAPVDVRTLIAPVISTPMWRTDVWLATTAPSSTNVFEDAIEGVDGLARLVLVLPPPLFGHSRVRTDGVSQYVPLLPQNGAQEQHLLFLENTPPYRTNLGIIANGDAIADVVIYDAAGNEIATQLFATEAGVRQTPVSLPVHGGRARVRFHGTPGQAYASLVDGRTGDATYIVYSSPRNDR